MSPTMPDSLSRLRAANPVPVDDDMGGKVVAQAALQRILADPGAPAIPARRRRRGLPRGLILVFAAMLLGAGAAVATTDPFGWWSANPDTARYGVNPARRVRTPKAQEITCRPGSAGGFRCAAGGPGQRYMQIDAIQPPQSTSLFSRAHFNAAISRQLAAGKMTAIAAARFRADVAHVPDSFFTELRLASRFVTYGGGSDGPGRELVPPIGVPDMLVCENAGTALACQDLNGDQHVPVGAGIYQAQQATDWRPAPPRRGDFALPPGISFTKAEYQLLFDLARGATSSGASTSSSSSSPSTGNNGTSRRNTPQRSHDK